ncbi:MAG: hypothetical protein P1U56_00615 [Saprospiraceae bacterium]|nr:hypothetical protein [Saprospiraceae bacterium]
MKKNYWSIAQSRAIFNYRINEEDYDIDVYINLMKRVIASGRKYEIFKILDITGTKDVGDEYIEMWLDFIRRNDFDNSNFKEKLKGDAFVTACHFSFVNKMIDYNACVKMAYYDAKGEIKLDTVFTNDVFYPLLNQDRVHLYHKNEIGCNEPLEVRLEIRYGKYLELSIDTGLGIWYPYFMPDIEKSEWNTIDFFIDESGWMDNTEMFTLNTIRLLSFDQEIRDFIFANKGKETNRRIDFLTSANDNIALLRNYI